MVFAVCNDRAGGFGSEDAAFGVEADQSAGEEAVGPDLARGQESLICAPTAFTPTSPPATASSPRTVALPIACSMRAPLEEFMPTSPPRLPPYFPALLRLATSPSKPTWEIRPLFSPTRPPTAAPFALAIRPVARLPDDAKVLADQSADGRALL